MSEKDDAQKSTKSKIPFKLLSSIVATIFTAVAGYYVYAILDKEIVEIANIEVKQLAFNIEIPKKLREKMNELDDREIYIDGEREDRFRNVSEQSFKDFLRKMDKKIEKNDERLSRYNSDFAEASKIDDFVDQDNITVLKRLARKVRVDFDESDLEGTKSRIISDISELIEPLNNTLTDIRGVVKELADLAYEQAVENESKYQIEVVLFNSGGKQAVVRYKGQLIIDDTVVNLKRIYIHNKLSERDLLIASAISGKQPSESFLEDFVIIESKSFNGMTLIVDEYNNRQRDIEFSEREYRAGQKKGSLFIYNINDKKTKNKLFDFRNALYEEDKESLKSFLTSEYSKYLRRIES
ncbi:hypothetical protein SNR37_001157 [Agarivorans aestuarii]|uniref:Uncharacterized protein n=1 Tax=Agarivorans aestuarii TaxID=1563703 RepID=A0ABU7G993_9ALTE|nr:hypothetical protein [Agarivorans aestuarii]MEE1675830.1 hypothetical protein [Agarivorans aestuarii]